MPYSMDNFTIVKFTTQPVTIPLKRPFVTHLHTVKAIEAVQLQLFLKNGLVGTGTATPNPVVTGDNLTSLKLVLDQLIGPQMIGQTLTQLEPLFNKLAHCVVGNFPAKAAADIAIYDLLSQRYQVPLTQLLGGAKQSMTTDYTISIGPRKQMVTEAQNLVKAGFTALKIKIGNQAVTEDVATVQAIATAVGPQINLRLDVNQGWSYKQALQAIHYFELADLHPAFLEQPLPANQLTSLAQLRQVSPIPIMLDESVFSPQEALRVITLHAADYINIKLMKSGGLHAATIINQLCATAGIPCMVGCMIEAPTSIAAAVAFANAHRNVHFIDLDSLLMIAPNQAQLGKLHCDGPRLWLEK